MGDFLVLAQRIKELRKKMEKTQKEFAEIVGCTSATLSAYENGSKSPSLEIVKNIAEKCHVSIDWLCGLSDKENNGGTIETYSDLIQYLFKLLEIKSAKTDFFSFDDVNAVFIGFDNTKLNSFLKDWLKIKKLFDEKIIDEEMYNPWLKSKLEEYDIPIKGNTSNSIKYFKDIVIENIYEK